MVGLGRVLWGCGICRGAGVALQALGAHPGRLWGARPALGLPGTRWALGMGQAIDSFPPPSILCGRMVPCTGLEHNFHLNQRGLLNGWTASSCIGKCSGPWQKHLPFSHAAEVLFHLGETPLAKGVMFQPAVP